MGPFWLGIFAICSSLVYVIVYPLLYYLYDPKGFRKYPAVNPLAGVTNFAFCWEARRGILRSRKLAERHKVHPVVRIGPNALSFRGGEAIRDIYGHGTPCLKDDFYKALTGSHFHLADVIEKNEHARKRKVLSAAYALKNLENWEHKIADKVERFIKACDSYCTAPLLPGSEPSCQDVEFDYRLWTNFFTLDAIADIGLSDTLSLLDRGHDMVTAQRMDGSLYEASLIESLHATGSVQTQTVWSYEWYKVTERVTRHLSPRLRHLWQKGDAWGDLVYHRACERLRRYQAGEKLDDFFSCLMEDKVGAPNNLEWGEIVAEVSIMLNAGSDTTAIAMNNVMYWLLKHPKKLAMLRSEVDSVLQDDEMIAPYDKVRHLPYLRACLDESLRITPSVTFHVPRKTPPEGAIIGSELVPGNTSVGISAYVAHRDETKFADPEEFKPERWLDPEKGKEMQPFFVAFSAGARGCIGRNISYLEQAVLLASVIHRYEMALPSRTWEPHRLEGTNMYFKSMPVKVWRRQFVSIDEV